MPLWEHCSVLFTFLKESVFLHVSYHLLYDSEYSLSRFVIYLLPSMPSLTVLNVLLFSPNTITVRYLIQKQ